MDSQQTALNQDAEHLRLLSIFHYVVGALAALFSFLPLLYAGMGFLFIYAARHDHARPGQQVPPEVLGWIFITAGCAFFLIALGVAVCILLAGRALSRRRRYWFVFVTACIECLFMPFGTILGIFTLIVLSREPVKRVFFPVPATARGDSPSVSS